MPDMDQTEPLPFLEDLSDREAADLWQARVTETNGYWTLVLLAYPPARSAVVVLGQFDDVPDGAHIEMLLAARGLALKHPGWMPWAGVAPNRYRQTHIGPAALIERWNTDAAGPAGRSKSEHSWANWLAVFGAVVCLAAMTNEPIYFYTVVRFFLFSTSIALIVLCFRRELFASIIPLGFIAFLWNPLIPFYLSRGQWLFRDAVAALAFIMIAIVLRRKRTLPAGSLYNRY